MEPQDELETEAAQTAPEDPILAQRLDAPSDPSEIYLEEASVYRPVSTGDIFVDVPVPGCPADDAHFSLTMVLAHPSAMRRGALLEPLLRAAPVAPRMGVSKKKWSRGYYDLYPLPLLRQVAAANGFELEDRGWCALIGLAAPVDSSQLEVTHRLACLSPDGIHLLLQRLVHADTRVPVRIDLLQEVFEPKLAELEMLESWNEDLVAPLQVEGADLLGALRKAAEEFEETMSECKHRGGKSIRQLLESDTGAGEAHRLLHEEIRRRGLG